MSRTIAIWLCVNVFRIIIIFECFLCRFWNLFNDKCNSYSLALIFDVNSEYWDNGLLIWMSGIAKYFYWSWWDDCFWCRLSVGGITCSVIVEASLSELFQLWLPLQTFQTLFIHSKYLLNSLIILIREKEEVNR